MINEGKLKYAIDLRHGVEECPRGLKDLLAGRNIGKVLIKIQNNEALQAKLW